MTVIINAPDGDNALNRTIGLDITAGSGATDVGARIVVPDVSMCGIEMHKGGTGVFMKFYEDVNALPGGSGAASTQIGDGANFETNKFVIISGVFSVSNPGPGPQTITTMHPASTRSNMLSIWADVALAMELRAPTDDPEIYYLISGMDAYGKERFALMQTGELRFSASGIQTGNYANGGSMAATVGQLNLRLTPTQDNRLRLWSSNPSAHGEAQLEIQKNGALVGESADGTVRNLLKYDGGNVVVLGSTYAGMQIRTNPASSVKLDITDMQSLLYLKSWTKTQLNLQIGASGNARAIAWCSDEAGGAQPVWSDGTNWRRFSDGAVMS